MLQAAVSNFQPTFTIAFLIVCKGPIRGGFRIDITFILKFLCSCFCLFYFIKPTVSGLNYASALNFHRAHIVGYASGLYRCLHLYSCTAVSASVCNYTAKPLVGTGISMALF